MENKGLKEEDEASQSPSSHSSSTGRRSPDFEFWMVRNPSFPQPDLHTADELFINGVLRPLHPLQSDPPDLEPSVPKSEQGPFVQTADNEGVGDGPELTAASRESTTQLTASKRWKDMPFKNGGSGKDKQKKKERKTPSRTSSAELNINIWPFSRSRSAGNNGVRPKQVIGASVTRKVSSAPCSRSNSAGDSKTRKLANSPCRNGVHLGRASPVWHVRRGTEKTARKETTENHHQSKIPAGRCKAKVLNLNVPMCMSYRNHLSCKSDGYSAVNSVGVDGGKGSRITTGGDCSVPCGSGGLSGGGGNLFSLRSLFTKKELMMTDTIERAREPHLNLKGYLQNAYIHPDFKCGDDSSDDETLKNWQDTENALVPTKCHSRRNTPLPSNYSHGSSARSLSEVQEHVIYV